jgi:hypothetical protein
VALCYLHAALGLLRHAPMQVAALETLVMQAASTPLHPWPMTALCEAMRRVRASHAWTELRDLACVCAMHAHAHAHAHALAAS